jgi:hypothetical protein
MKYFLTTNTGAINGMIKENLRDVTICGVSLAFSEMYQIKKVVDHFCQQFPENDIKKDFLKLD